ncbi:MAG: hypothetical protein GEU82_15260 [Luteitalea sp.]|nr:hypothetical protein [Luteitalea sp.]
MTTPLHAVRRIQGALVAAMPVVALAAFIPAQSQPAVHAAEVRAVAYLSTEVPRWRREHSCYSCHNNGDATRALVAASARGYAVGHAIDDTTAWLAMPERWDSNPERGGSEDLPLARIQFASALASMVAVGRATPDALDRAGALLLVHQTDDGSWRLSESQVLGGATFYGTSLATAMARRILARVKDDVVQRPLAKAGAWLRTTNPATVLDASSVLLGLELDVDSAAVAQRQKALDVVTRGRGPDGGWGPYITSQSEPFDTALAVLALVNVRNVSALSAVPYSDRDLDEAIGRARDYLVGAQNQDGSWPETTRPPNGESYAQRISTTAWSLLALLESD